MADCTVGERKRVLIADNGRDNRKILRAQLERMGSFDIEEAANGLEALRSIEKTRPDVVLMDMHMPYMDGYEATRRIRASANGIATVPIIALTTACLSYEIERCSRAGASDYIAKPFADAELLRVKVLFWSGLGHDEALHPPIVTDVATARGRRAQRNGR
jgi:CheY-like chemotaxis protein